MLHPHCFTRSVTLFLIKSTLVLTLGLLDFGWPSATGSSHGTADAHSVAHDSVAHGSVAHDSVAHGSVAHGSVGCWAATFFLVVRRFFFAGSASTGAGIVCSTEVILCSLFDARCYRCF